MTRTSIDAARKNALEDFRGLVLRDPVLQDLLRALSDLDEFIDRVVQLAAANGYEFTADEVTEAMRENKRLWIERWI